MNRLKLTLYVSGHTTISERAIHNLNRICDEYYANQYDLTIIDILEKTEFIEEIRILATPTLIKEEPAPWRRLVGDFSDVERVLYGLGYQVNMNELHDNNDSK